MKKGQIIAIVIAIAVVAAVYMVDRTPKSASVEVITPDVETPAATNTLDDKVNEAVEIIQSGSQPPMVAVQMLREVIQADSNHFAATLWLGEFSMMSGQYDKAAVRYKKLLRLQPANAEACIKLARAYQAMGNNVPAQDVLKAFLSAHPDHEMKEQILSALKEVSNS